MNYGEEIMADYKIWNVGHGELTITIGSLRPFILYPLLSLVTSGTLSPLPFNEDSGVFSVNLTAAQVGQLILSPTSAGAPFLFLSCNALFHPGAPDRKWGWRMRVSQGGIACQAQLDDGTAIALDSEGYARSGLFTFPDGKNAETETTIISLA